MIERNFYDCLLSPETRCSNERHLHVSLYLLHSRVEAKAIRGEIKLQQAFLIKHSPAMLSCRFAIACALRKIELNYYYYTHLPSLWLRDWFVLLREVKQFLRCPRIAGNKRAGIRIRHKLQRFN